MGEIKLTLPVKGRRKEKTKKEREKEKRGI